MSTLKRSQLVAAAKELNEQLGLEPAIDTKPGKKNSYLQEMITQAGELVDPKQDEFSDETWEVLKALGVNTEVEEGEGEEEEPEPEKAPEKEEGSKESEEEGTPEPEPEPEPEKPAKGKKKDKAKPAKEKAFKGPGVIKTIASLVEQAGKKGITKEEILEGLQDAFPDRDADAMRKTINVQVPNRITKEKFPVGKKEGGRYFKEGK